MLVCRCYIIKKLRDAVTAVAVTVAAVAMTAARAPSTPSRAVASALVAYLGVARPQGASVGNKLSRGLSSERAHPGYYCLIDGQTNGSRPPSNNVVIKLSAGADKSVTDPTSAHGRGGSHRLRTAAHRLSYVLPPPFITSVSRSLARLLSLSLRLSLSSTPLPLPTSPCRHGHQSDVSFTRPSRDTLCFNVRTRCRLRVRTSPRLEHADIIRYASGQSNQLRSLDVMREWAITFYIILYNVVFALTSNVNIRLSNDFL